MDTKNKKATLMMAFLNGAGSIRAYPHAENTGLVISDVAKIGTIFQKCKFLRDFLNSIIKNYFLHFFSQALASFFSQQDLASFFSQQDLASFFSQALASFFSQQALASFFSQQALASFFSQARSILSCSCRTYDPERWHLL